VKEEVFDGADAELGESLRDDGAYARERLDRLRDLIEAGADAGPWPGAGWVQPAEARRNSGRCDLRSQDARSIGPATDPGQEARVETAPSGDRHDGGTNLAQIWHEVVTDM
jgi:hypothetical protein